MSVKWKSQWKTLTWLLGGFVLCYFLPMGEPRFRNALLEAFALVRWYAREHVILCLLPAFYIAGAIGVFVSQGSVMRYLGPRAPKALAYGVASVSGTLLAVCSCTVLPLFAGIHQMGAGLGPATTFLYSGPAINVLAIVLTARVLGLEIGIARAVGAILFSIIIGLCMHLIFRREEAEKQRKAPVMPTDEDARPLYQTALFFASLVGVLVFANWGRSDDPGLWRNIYLAKWWLTGANGVGLGIILATWLGLGWSRVLAVGGATLIGALVLPQHPSLAFGLGIVVLSLLLSRMDGEAGAWFETSWRFAVQILPLLLGGVFIAGLLLGRPESEGLIPSDWVASSVGGNGLGANLFASAAGAFMYFATLTEVPILQGLLDNGMGKGPALALLLAGPALSLPNMLVIRSVMGNRKTLVFVGLVVVMATISGMIYGMM